MYRIGMKSEFVARHYLVGGDWGAENTEHSHYYQVEVELQGETLDEHGYLTDFVEVEARMLEATNHYREAVLNALPEFAGLNPSVEHLARAFCESLLSGIVAQNLTGVAVRIWEKPGVWAAYEERLR